MYLEDKIQHLLDNTGHALISIVGSGGKTTQLYELLAHFRPTVSTVVTTTTMMFTPDVPLDHTIFLEGLTLESKLGKNDGIAQREIKTLGLFETQVGDKVKGVTPEVLDALVSYREYPLILNEADGAKGKPLKAYGGHEPVIPLQTDLVIIMMGLDGLFKPLTDEWVHRGHLLSDLTGLPMGAPVTLETLLKILTHQEGFLKGIPIHGDAVVVLNKWDALTEQIQLNAFAQSLFYRAPQIQAVEVTALKYHEEIQVYERGSL